MLEWLYSLLVSYPGAFKAMGRTLFSLAGLLAVLGLRLDRIGSKVERISARTGIAPPDFLAGLPWWLRMVIPETASGWILIGAMALLGIWLAHIGKWAGTLR